MRDRIKNFREAWLFGTAALFLIILIFIMAKSDLTQKVMQYTSHVSNQDEVQMIPNFTAGMKVQQSFTCAQDFDFITLDFSDHDQMLSGKFAVMITDKESEEVLLYEDLDAATVRYGTPVELSFQEAGGGKAGNGYEVTLLSIESEETALGIYGYEKESETALIDGNVSEYALSIGIHSNTGIYKNVSILILIISMLAVFGVIAGAFVFHLKEQHMFLLLAIPFGFCMLLLWPGNKVYDEMKHYHTIYHYSNILLGCGEGDKATEINMRQCDVIDKQQEESRNTAVNGQAQDYWYYMQEMNSPAGDKGTVLTDISDMTVVENGTVIEYLPGVIGMTLGRLLRCNYFWMMTIMRLVLFGSYIAMCYYAIKITPVLKMAIVFISALPMGLYQASGVTYDSFTYGIGILFLAFVMKLWKQGLQKREWMMLALLVFVLGSCKGGVYLTLVLLLFLIPGEKYEGDKWKKSLAILLIAGVSMLISFIPTIMRWFGIGSNKALIINSVELESGNYHLVYAFKEPIEFTKLFIRTLIEKSDTYLGQTLGYRTAWSNQVISLAVMFLFLLILVLAGVRMKEDDFEISMGARLGIFAVLVIELVGMHSIFLVETPVHSSVIEGFQGRYFIPFLPCILLLIRNNGLVFKEKEAYLYPCFGMAQLIYIYFFLGMFMCG